MIPGTIPVTGQLAPTDPTDNYAIIDPRYGIDGFRNVDTFAERNAIPELRRRAGMLVGVAEDNNNIYQLKPGPWTYTDSDWVLFLPGTGVPNGQSSIDILQNDVPILTNVTKLNFIGDSVLISVPSPSSDQVDIYIEKKWGTKKFINSIETITVFPDYQYFIYGDLIVEGIFNNYGEVVIANGNLILQGGGQFNNLGSGILKLINLATGDSIRVVIKNFSAISGVPLVLTHDLNTKDFTFNVREGNTLIDVQLTHIDDNSVEIVTTSDVNSATIIFQSKLS